MPSCDASSRCCGFWGEIKCHRSFEECRRCWTLKNPLHNYGFLWGAEQSLFLSVETSEGPTGQVDSIAITCFVRSCKFYLAMAIGNEIQPFNGLIGISSTESFCISLARDHWDSSIFPSVWYMSATTQF